MAHYPLTLNLPQKLYQQLESEAQEKSQPISEWALQILSHHTPHLTIETDLSVAVQTDLATMEQLSDDLLWQIAESQFNRDKLLVYDVLLQRLNDEQLTAEGRIVLTQLREESELLALRKSHAFALLKNRGHKLPTLSALHQQAS